MDGVKNYFWAYRTFYTVVGCASGKVSFERFNNVNALVLHIDQYSCSSHHCGHRKVGFDSFLNSKRLGKRRPFDTPAFNNWNYFMKNEWIFLVFKQYFWTNCALYGEICWQRATFPISWNSVTHFYIDFWITRCSRRGNSGLHIFSWFVITAV